METKKISCKTDINNQKETTSNKSNVKKGNKLQDRRKNEPKNKPMNKLNTNQLIKQAEGRKEGFDLSSKTNLKIQKTSSNTHIN